MTKRRASAPERGFEVLEPGFQVSRKLTGECPLCGKPKLDVTRKPPGSHPPYYISCFVCEAAGIVGAEYLAGVAEAVGCRPYQLLEDPLTHLDSLLDQPQSVAPVRHAPPTETRVRGWRQALKAHPEALGYLRGRGLTLATIARYELGYDADADAITLPVRDTGELVAVKRRYLDPAADPKTLNSPGPASLYPDLPSRRKLLLVAGEFDALIGRQLGLPALTTTCGAKLPDPLVHRLLGHAPYIMFDVGEETAAARVTRKLRAAGIEASVVRLASLGLPHGTDLNDFYRQGGTVEQIRDLCRRARGTA